MISLEGSSKIASVLEDTFLYWIRQYPPFSNLPNICHLANGEFFLFLIKTIPDFKLTEPIFTQTADDSLPTKITFLNNIIGSLKEYIKKRVEKDVCWLVMNPVELAMGNRQEIIKMISLMIRVIVHSSAKEDFLLTLMKMPEEHMEVFKIVIENCLKTGEGGNSSMSSPPSDRSKILRRME